MGLAGGGFLRLSQTALYALEFCCAGIILGIFSYFLAHLSHHNLHIPTWEKAVEGLSGAACLYLIFAVLLTCFLGGVSFFAFVAIVLDILFVGAFIAMAVLTRHGASSCKGNVNTPIGSGAASSDANGTSLRTACKLNTAAFSVSIIGALLFLLAALMQLALVRHHKKEKKFGPSPANNYTSGSGKKSRFGRKNKDTVHDEKRDAELGAGAVGAGGLAAAHHHNNHATDMRPSHDTAYTGSTVAAPNANGTHYNTRISKEIDPNLQQAQAAHGHHAPHGTHGGYYTAPVGTANPYGYENTTGTTGTTGTARNF